MILDQFNCEDCTYSCKSKPALSRHKTMKHKVIVNKNQKKLFNGMLLEKKIENKKEECLRRKGKISVYVKRKKKAYKEEKE